MMVLAAETESRTSLLRLRQRERKASKSSQCACGSFAHDPKTQSHSNFLMTHFYGVERVCVCETILDHCMFQTILVLCLIDCCDHLQAQREHRGFCELQFFMPHFTNQLIITTLFYLELI